MMEMGKTRKETYVEQKGNIKKDNIDLKINLNREEIDLS